MPEITPRVLEASNRFRARLLTRERQAASAMARYYGHTWQELQPQISGLRAEVEGMIEAGEEVGPGRLWRLERMQAIEAQVEQELGRFADYAGNQIAAEMRTAIAAGEREALELIEASFPADAGIEISFKRMPREAVESLVGFLADGSPLAELIQEAVAEAAQGFSQAMVTGLAAGWNPRKLARRLRSEFGMGLTRALRIARTEQLRAYREATRQAYLANKDVVTGWERHAAKDARTCMACVMLDGTKYSCVVAMDDHVNGRCAMLPITKTYAELGIDAPEPEFQRELASDWFRNLSPSEQREMMGPGMFEAWQAGQIGLDDIPRLIEDKTWGNSWVPSSLRELLKGGSFREFASAEEANAWASPIFKEWYGSLSPREKKVLKAYGGDAYEEFNEYLRKGTEPSIWWGDSAIRTLGKGRGIDDILQGRIGIEELADLFASRMDEAIAKAKIEESVVAWRGFGGGLADLNAGDVFEDVGFVSTSLSEDVALGFARKGGVLGRIEISAGSNAAYMGYYGVKEEAELLLARGLEFRVKSREEVGDVVQLVLEIVS